MCSVIHHPVNKGIYFGFMGIQNDLKSILVAIEEFPDKFCLGCALHINI